MVTLSSTFNQAAVIALHKAIKTEATSLGVFRRVVGHEPKASPGTGLSYVYWLGPIEPVPRASGLAGTAGRVIFNGRIYAPWLAKDEDQTETDLVHALLELLASYSSHITVGGTVHAIDLLGMYGVPLTSATVGYTELGGDHYRAADLTIPVIIDALWTQVN